MTGKSGRLSGHCLIIGGINKSLSKNCLDRLFMINTLRFSVFYLDIEQEVHYVTVLYDIFLALGGKLSGSPYGSL